MAKIASLAEAFEHTLRDIYYAENAIVKALPKVAAKAHSGQLKAALDQHLTESQGQVTMLEGVFAAMGVKAVGERCQAIEGIISEGEAHMKEAEQPALDAIIVANSQAIEHYEITRYGTLIAWAKELGYADAERVLEEILHQEKAADQKLTMIAETAINERAQGVSYAAQ